MRFYNCSYSRNNEEFKTIELGKKIVGMRCDDVYLSLEEVLKLFEQYTMDRKQTIHYLVMLNCTKRPKKNESK